MPAAALIVYLYDRYTFYFRDTDLDLNLADRNLDHLFVQ